MRSLCSLLLLLCLNDACIAQESVSAQPAITVRSTLVMVPVFVNTKKGQPVFDLEADDFRLTDNGVQQTLTLEKDTDSEPLALAVEIGRHTSELQSHHDLVCRLLLEKKKKKKKKKNK